MTTEVEKFSYSLGMDIGNNIKNANFDSLAIDLVISGLSDVLNKKETAFNSEEAGIIIREYITKMQQAAGQKKVTEGKNFLTENAKRQGVVTLPSGLQYEIIIAGTGNKPTLNDQVTTHYTGTLLDGTVFDSSVKRGEPATFPVSGVIAGWTEALQLMPVGSKWKLFIPSDLAYGERGAGGAIGPNETLIFEIELISINK
ncbi:MAG TPA: FKBP-type peptidyl-prolyl cis-trans isomerase [Luteibaculaceae bacterium]|nr:FKBP-type peptidyl-prolyl cis-trans isomerase [Luteibaculaceae bacterium]